MAPIRNGNTTTSGSRLKFSMARNPRPHTALISAAATGMTMPRLERKNKQKHHQHGDNGVDKYLQRLRHIALNVADVHGVSGNGNKVVVIFILFPQFLQLLEGDPVIHLLF